MSDKSIPADVQPLSAFEYFQESVRAWGTFSQTTSRLMVTHLQKGYPTLASLQTDETTGEPLPGELLRAVSDLNLRHWQNTARFLEGLPSWMRAPQNVSGSALVDWFDRLNRVAEDRFAPLAATQFPEPEVTRPRFLSTPKGQPDDLTRIKGIGKKLSKLLNELGVFHFSQIAAWTAAEAAWIDDYLAFKGRVSRENWIGQAQSFATNGTTSLALH